MPQFFYKAKNAQGKELSGKVDAQSETDAVGDLRRQGLVIIGLSEKRGAGARSVSSSRLGKSGRGKNINLSTVRLKTAEMVVFTRQLSTMISAGIPLVEALEILSEQTNNAGFGLVLESVINDVRSGKDLSQSLERYPRVFPKIYVNMIRAGEASGQLDIVLIRLAEYQEDSARLKSEIKSAMTYPVVSLVMVIGITLFLLVFIVPKFEEMFRTMAVDLPFVTRALLVTALTLKNNFVLWSIGMIAVTIGIFFYFRTEKGAYVKDWIVLKLPVFGPLFLKVALSRFSRTFGTLIQSGVPILGALEIVSETTGNRILGDAINNASASVRQGDTLGEPLANSGAFPLMVTRMISIGEKSGALESLLSKIADFYDQQVKSTVGALTSLIEPLLIGVMGALVGGMVMAIFLPIFKMIGALSGKG